ncbi:unnamed protein product [Cuscuta campestris]|uniref:glucan endo-1,3-beta-D-glucosidase n=1 Tax=Cuscuta campestris TaxID=132261 RepID=A0A484NSA1_9ASTE|nr:unnamed protein product [Cuscuta campestris]
MLLRKGEERISALRYHVDLKNYEFHSMNNMDTCTDDLTGFGFLREVKSLGINYGQLGDNLLPPEKVLQLLRAYKITKTRIYDTNPKILTAFANSGVELIVTVENQRLAALGGSDPQPAAQWVETQIRPFFPATNITGIDVGNEVITDGDTSLMGYLVPAMVNVRRALASLGFDRNIKVSSPHSLAVLGNSYPPSGGYFKPELAGMMQQFLKFLAETESPFWINAYPFFAYKDSPNKIPLDYVLFNPGAAGTVDPATNLRYDNMMYAQVDAVLVAMYRLGFNAVEVRVSETGWPSKGDPNEVGASPENARIFNGNLMRRQRMNQGTPLRPGLRLEVYVFALFNENQKPGPTSERNYGLFLPDGTLAYDVGLSSESAVPSSPSTPSAATISLTSSAPKAEHMEYQSFVHTSILFFLGCHVILTM